MAYLVDAETTGQIIVTPTTLEAIQVAESQYMDIVATNSLDIPSNPWFPSIRNGEVVMTFTFKKAGLHEANASNPLSVINYLALMRSIASQYNFERNSTNLTNFREE